MMTKKVISAAIAVLFASALTTNAQDANYPKIESWITKADRSMLFQKDETPIMFGPISAGKPLPVIVDDRQQFQTIDGFGFALTGGSAQHLIAMTPSERTKILKELFAHDGKNVGFSYIRLSIGASDLNSFVFSYNDIPEGKTDFELKKFSLAQDLNDVVPVLKEILTINPDIKIMGSPWSAPAWMKSHFNVRGGKLRPECYDVYARYFVRYIQEMKSNGIRIDAVTIQNEPLNNRNTPSMPWFQHEQAEFVKTNLGPAFKSAGIDTKIVIFDHNCDRPDYPLAILSNPDASKYIDGSGFHHYVGDLSGMSQVHMARPDKNIYFTEQMVTEKPGDSQINIVQQVNRMIIDVTRNWSRNVILWNLAADALNDPHTDNGGCSMCQGAITIDGDKITRNIAYYVIAHASKFVRPGSVRIASTAQNDSGIALFEDEQRPGVFRAVMAEDINALPNVAFKNPDGQIVLIVANNSWDKRSIKVQYNGMYASIDIQPGSVGTYIWK